MGYFTLHTTHLSLVCLMSVKFISHICKLSWLSPYRIHSPSSFIQPPFSMDKFQANSPRKATKPTPAENIFHWHYVWMFLPLKLFNICTILSVQNVLFFYNFSFLFFFPFYKNKRERKKEANGLSLLDWLHLKNGKKIVLVERVHYEFLVWGV